MDIFAEMLAVVKTILTIASVSGFVVSVYFGIRFTMQKSGVLEVGKKDIILNGVPFRWVVYSLIFSPLGNIVRLF